MLEMMSQAQNIEGFSTLSANNGRERLQQILNNGIGQRLP
jgi:hypothetical protein